MLVKITKKKRTVNLSRNMMILFEKTDLIVNEEYYDETKEQISYNMKQVKM